MLGVHYLIANRHQFAHLNSHKANTWRSHASTPHTRDIHECNQATLKHISNQNVLYVRVRIRRTPKVRTAAWSIAIRARQRFHGRKSYAILYAGLSWNSVFAFKTHHRATIISAPCHLIAVCGAV